MLVRRSAKFRGNSRRKSCEESRRNGAAARTSGKPRLDGRPDLEVSQKSVCTLPHQWHEAHPNTLGARCRSQIAPGAPGPGANAGKSWCDTCSRPQAVASLRRWQEKAVVRERPPNKPSHAPRTASPAAAYPGRARARRPLQSARTAEI